MKRRDKIDDLFERHLFPLVKGVFGVAVVAAQITKSEPDKDTTLARPGTLALDGLVNLVDRQRFVTHSTLWQFYQIIRLDAQPDRQVFRPPPFGKAQRIYSLHLCGRSESGQDCR